MRLLRIEEVSEFGLVECVGREIPPYAILSHAWGQAHEEVTFQDIMRNIQE